MVIISAMPRWVQKLPHHDLPDGFMSTSVVASLGYGRRKRYSSVVSRPAALLLVREETEERDDINSQEEEGFSAIMQAYPVHDAARLRRRLLMKHYLACWDMVMFEEDVSRKAVLKMAEWSLANLQKQSTETWWHSSFQEEYCIRIQSWLRRLNKAECGRGALRRDLQVLRKEQARSKLERVRMCREQAAAELSDASRHDEGTYVSNAIHLLVQHEAGQRQDINESCAAQYRGIHTEHVVRLFRCAIDEACASLLRIETRQRTAIVRLAGDEAAVLAHNMRLCILAADCRVVEATRSIFHWWRRCKQGVYARSCKRFQLSRRLRLGRALREREEKWKIVPYQSTASYVPLSDVLNVKMKRPKPPKERPTNLRQTESFRRRDTMPFTPFVSKIHMFVSDAEYVLHSISVEEALAWDIMMTKRCAQERWWELIAAEEYKRAMLSLAITPTMVLLEEEGRCYKARQATKAEEKDHRAELRRMYMDDKRASLQLSMLTLFSHETDQRNELESGLQLLLEDLLETCRELATSAQTLVSHKELLDDEGEMRADLEYTEVSRYITKIRLVHVRGLQRMCVKQEQVNRSNIISSEVRAAFELVDHLKQLLCGVALVGDKAVDKAPLPPPVRRKASDPPPTTLRTMLQAVANREADKRSSISTAELSYRAILMERWYAGLAVFHGNQRVSLLEREAGCRTTVATEETAAYKEVTQAIVAEMLDINVAAAEYYCDAIQQIEVQEANYRGNLGFEEDDAAWFLNSLNALRPLTLAKVAEAVACSESGTRLSITRSWELSLHDLVQTSYQRCSDLGLGGHMPGPNANVLKPPSSLIDPATGLAIADYSSLPLECHTAFQKIFETDTGLGGVYLLAEVLKFNKKLIEQRRVLVITRDALYLCTPRAEVLRCSKLELIHEVYSFNNIIAFRIPEEYDVMLRITKNNRTTDTAVVAYLKHVLKRLTNVPIHENQVWLDTRASSASRETVKATLQLGRSKGWIATRPLPIVKFAWKDLVLRPGFDDTWRRLHPSRSKQIWELKEYYEKEKRTENYVEDTKFSVHPARADRTQPTPPISQDAVPSLLSPPEIRSKLLAPQGSRAASPTKETHSSYGVFDIIASTPMTFRHQSPGARHPPSASPQYRQPSPQHRRPSPPRTSPPSQEPYYSMPRQASPSANSIVMGEGQSQYFPPSPRAGSVPLSMSHPAPLDPFLIELAAAASPVPYNVHELQHAAKITKDREDLETPDTPLAMYEPSPRKGEGILSERLTSNVGATVGVRPSAMAPPPGLSTPATHYWSKAEEPRRASTAETPGHIDDYNRNEHTSAHGKAADIAKALSEATRKPGGGGADARKAISEMLRTTAALLNAEDSVRSHEERMAALAKATPSPGTRGQKGDMRLQALIQEQERQRLGLENVCRKLDALLQPASREPSPEETPVGHWDGEDPLDTNSLIGTPLLPMPRHSLSRYQQSLKSSIRPLASTPPAGYRASPHRTPRSTRKSKHYYQ